MSPLVDDPLSTRTAAQREAIEQRIDELEQRGQLTADAVIDDAKDPDSPMHPCFQWDVAIAAREHWRYTARKLINSVKYVYHTETTDIVVSKYVHNPDAPPGVQGYLSVPRILTQKDLARRALLEEFYRALEVFRRASHYAHVFGVQQDVDDLIRRVTRVSTKITKPNTKSGRNGRGD